ncbi:hypothetical protein [Dialister micraerophilus]|uniref:LysM domain-containing protein n=1 Tax=Dialister micraerophilus UPII 345-E TaxID=910314 RepID=E4LAB5_9FIRM|nr:hypothetical protein [Dialister micraerophilus]EFR42276.1 hypothetical protein HMPREF9220_0745 [Dialister micraerophilus UPII 345-E]
MKLKTQIAVIVIILICIGAGYIRYKTNQPYSYIEYHREVGRGETIWGICSEIATDKEDVRELVWHTMKINNIKSVDQVQEGLMLVIRTKRKGNTEKPYKGEMENSCIQKRKDK